MIESGNHQERRKIEDRASHFCAGASRQLSTIYIYHIAAGERGGAVRWFSIRRCHSTVTVNISSNTVTVSIRVLVVVERALLRDLLSGQSEQCINLSTLVQHHIISRAETVHKH